ncbi:MAG: hypothetical protein AMJ75_00455 [Phycisphaerae bacterium SM1_79]|nr:MAG: hypothetical protein AMJ75_00455 [Phycisphaerae bacterium SM1_79]
MEKLREKWGNSEIVSKKRSGQRKLDAWKPKVKRQAWWRGLTEAERSEQLDRWRDEKAYDRRLRSLEIMADVDGFSCSDCYHRLVRCCLDDLPRGCEYWFSPGSDRIGLAYDE